MKVKHKDKITPVVGITGLPASGKTTVLRAFARAGFKTLSADDLARGEFARKGNLKRIRKIFGASSRLRLAEVVFADGEKRRALENIIHPGVIKTILAAAKSARRARRPLAIEVPLLFEKKLEKMFNTIVTVASPRRLIMARLASKGISRRTAAGMIRAHLPQARKAAMADIVIKNDGSRKKLSAALRQVIKVARKVE